MLDATKPLLKVKNRPNGKKFDQDFPFAGYLFLQVALSLNIPSEKILIWLIGW